MDTDRLKYFCTIVETGSLSKASEILNISHSGLSKSLSLLQKEIQIQLVRPLGRGIEITPQGQVFYQKSLEVLNLVNGLSKVDESTTRPLSIGMSEVLALSCSDLLVKELSGEGLKLKQLFYGEAEEALLNFTMDFGFIFVPKPHPEVEYLKIGKVKFNSHARENLIKINNEFIPFAVPTSDFPSNPMGYKIRDGWPRNIKRNPYFFASSFGIALELLKQGFCASYLPDYIAKKESKKGPANNPIIKVPSHKKATTHRDLFLVKLKNIEESKKMKKATKVIRSTCCI